MSNVYLFSLSKIHHLFGYALLYQFQLENKIMILLHVTIEEAETSQLGGVCIVRVAKIPMKSSTVHAPKNSNKNDNN